eukprot:TRINITY_DN834_c3_g1_i1.p1 TRINITY_DN834_c3_g1~~TRINITY_DN834_c3_g1_i1.p1  ORF type:complete len:282 (+),score=95.15 TRINITY_DN834_c3_g1_i1:137-982(+)
MGWAPSKGSFAAAGKGAAGKGAGKSYGVVTLAKPAGKATGKATSWTPAATSWTPAAATTYKPAATTPSWTPSAVKGASYTPKGASKGFAQPAGKATTYTPKGAAKGAAASAYTPKGSGKTTITLTTSAKAAPKASGKAAGKAAAFQEFMSVMKGKSKGKGKGKKGKGKGKGEPNWAEKEASENRMPSDGTVYTGIITVWNSKYGWGFVNPDEPSLLPDEVQAMLAEATEKQKAKGKEVESEHLLYFRKPDVVEGFAPEKDAAVTFQVYTDDKGAGACEVSG